MNTIAAVVKKARASQQQVIINPAPAQFIEKEVLQGLFLITPNETEASLLTGIAVKDVDTAAEAAAVFLCKGVQNVIITLGKRGAYFHSSELQFVVDAPVVKAVDTTAAGDTFNGALAVALAEKMNWMDAVHFAVKAASLSVTKMGAQASIPHRDDLLIKLEI